MGIPTRILLATALACMAGCSNGGDEDEEPERDYKQDMRLFVRNLSTWARTVDTDFIVIPQNGHELVTQDGETTGSPDLPYLAAISGVGREDLYYGYDSDNVATSAGDTSYMGSFLDIAESNGVQAIVTDYCSTTTFVDDSYSKSETKGYTSFAAHRRELDAIPTYPSTPHDVHVGNVASLSQAQNFLYLLNTNLFANKAAFIAAVQATNYDVLIIDLYFNGTDAFTLSEVNSLKTKQNGGSRLVISYMSIGEAEDYRYYWQTGWTANPPGWLAAENPDWPGNYKVRYWDTAWQDIIFGNAGSYLKKILDAGFDGVYLDIIDAFEYFESLE